jgi:hypothetical protein
MAAGAIVLEFRIHGSFSYYPSGLNSNASFPDGGLFLCNPRRVSVSSFTLKSSWIAFKI